MEVLPLAEPPKEEVSISSAAGQDSPDSEPAKESTEDAQEESKVSANLSYVILLVFMLRLGSTQD